LLGAKLPFCPPFIRVDLNGDGQDGVFRVLAKSRFVLLRWSEVTVSLRHVALQLELDLMDQLVRLLQLLQKEVTGRTQVHLRLLDIKVGEIFFFWLFKPDFGFYWRHES
jgi:hypothetical protein